jgi:hypothetical protein
VPKALAAPHTRIPARAMSSPPRAGESPASPQGLGLVKQYAPRLNRTPPKVHPRSWLELSGRGARVAKTAQLQVQKPPPGVFDDGALFWAEVLAQGKNPGPYWTASILNTRLPDFLAGMKLASGCGKPATQSNAARKGGGWNKLFKCPKWRLPPPVRAATSATPGV